MNPPTEELITNDPCLPLKMPDGAPLPENPLKQLLREHSGARFFDQYPEAREASLVLLKEKKSRSLIARLIGPFVGRPDEAAGKDTGLRKLLHGLAEAHGIESTEAARSQAAELRDAALDRQLEMVPKAGVKELGALSMVGNLAHQVERSLGGQPISIHEERVVLSVEDFTQSLEAPRAVPVRPVYEAEVVGNDKTLATT